MATNIDERIVAAKFDASDFEKGVNKTLKKLDELKKSLDLKDATKGVKELAEKTEASTDSMSKSLEKLTERFTSFIGMIKQRILGGLADEVAGVFLRMEQSVTGFIRSISSDQVTAGMAKYEQMLTSVRIMMAAGESQSSSYVAIDKLREYSDQTSYSLSQMTDALSKMRAAGVDLDTATKSVEGIANACANAGVNASEAQRAFYNLSQAYAKGSLNYTDYKSLELLNMTTEKFKENMLEAAVEAGTLKKLSDGIYQTINTTDKKVKAGKKVTIQNASDMLKYDYMNNRAMNVLFGKKFYFDEKEFREYKKKWTNSKGEVDREKAIEEAKKDFGQIAVDAYLAAREARSFTDVINTLKDVVSTGWSTTFENLFGKLDEAVDFFTKLTEGDLAESIYRIGEWRNEVLETWNVLNAEGKGTGGELFRQTILNITDSLGLLIQTFEDILPGTDTFGERLLNATYSLRDFSIRVKESISSFREWMNSPMFENGPTRIEKIRSILGNLTKVFGIVARVAGSVISAFGKMITPIGALFDSMIGIDDTIVNLQTVLEPVSNVLEKVVSFLGDIAAFFVSMAVDTFGANVDFVSDLVGILMELFTGNSAQKLRDGEGVLGRIKNDFEGIKEACKTGLSAVKEFFGSLISDIRNLLGLTDESEKKEENQNGGIFSGLINFFNTNQFVQDAKKWVNQAIVDVGNFIKSIPNRVMQFGANIYDTLRKLFFKDETKYNGSQLETKSILTPLGEWVNQAIIDIKEFFSSIPQRIIEGVGVVTNWINEVFDYWFNKDNENYKKSEDNKKSEKNWAGKEEITSRFEDFISSTKASISSWFEDLPNKIHKAFYSIGNFATNLYKTLDEFLFGKKVRQTISVADGKGGLKYKDITVRYKTGFSKWLDGVIKEIRKFITNIPEYIKNGIKDVGDVLSLIVSSIFGKEDNKEVTGKDVTETLEKPFLGIDLGSILNTIAGIGREILNQIARIFTGTDDIDSNMNWFSEKIAEGINWIREKAVEGLNWLSETLANIPTTIANLFKKEDKETADKGPVGNAIMSFGEAIGTFITVTLPARILDFINNATTAFDDIWNKLYSKIIGGAEESSEEAVSEVDAISGAAPKKPELSAWQKFVENLGQTISNIWQKLPVWIAQGIDIAIAEIDKLISGFTDHIADANVQKETKEVTENTFKEVVEGMADSADKGESSEEPALLKSIKGIGERIKTLFIETIPGLISEAWTAISDLGSDIYKGISSIFSGEPVGEEASELTKMTENIGNSIKHWLTTELPGYIQPVWAEISSKATEIFKGFATIFTGKEPEGEIQTAVNSFGMTVYNFITTDIPAAIQKAFDFISKLFTKKEIDSFTDVQAQAKGQLTGKIHDAVIKPIAKDSEDISNETKKPGFWSFIDVIKDSLLGAFSSIGPAVLNGLTKALDWLNGIGSIIVNLISGKTTIGEEIEKAYGEEKPGLVESLKHVGESLKTFFLDTLPKFIGAAISSLIKNADEWFGKLFGAMSASAKAEEEDFFNDVADDLGGEGGRSFAEEFKGAFNFMGILKKLFDSIMNWVGENKTVIEIVGVIVALTMLFSKLTDLFGLADEFEEGARAIKWTGITLAIIAIAGIMSYITSLVNSKDTQKISAFESIIEKLGGLFEKIAWIMGLMTAGKLFDALGNRWDGSSKPAADIVGKLADGLGGFFKALGVGAGTYVAGGFINATIDTTFDTIGSAFTELVSDIESAVSFIDPAITKLMEMDTKLDKATSAVEKLGSLFAEFDKAIKTLYSEATGGTVYETNNPNALATWGAKSATGQKVATGPYEEIVSLSGYMKDLETSINLFLKLSEFINYLSNALDKFGSISDVEANIDDIEDLIHNSGKLTNFMVDLLNMLKSSIEGSNISPELLGSQFSSRTTSMSVALDLLADSLSIFTTGISGFNEDNLFALNETLEIFTKLSEAVNGVNFSQNSLAKIFIGDATLSKIGSEIKKFGSHMQLFYGYVSDISGFEVSRVEETKRKLDNIIEFTKNMAIAAGSVGEYGSSVELIRGLSEKLPGLGKGIGDMFTKLDSAMPKDFSESRSVVLLNAVRATMDIITAMKGLSDLLITYNALDISTIMDKVFTGMSSDINTDKIAAMVRVLDEGVAKAMNSEEHATDYQAIGSNLAKKLIAGMQSAIDTDPTLRITPVLNLDTAESQLKQLFGIEDLSNIDLSSVAKAAIGANNTTESKIIDYTKDLSDIKSEISALSGNLVSLDDIGSAFARIPVVLDSGQLVGGLSDRIDSAIGEKLWLITRGNAVTISPP